MKWLKCLLILLLITTSIIVKSQTISSWKVTKLQDLISRSDSVLVISFWATFCKPCIEEIPYFERIVKKYKNRKVKLLLVSLDLKQHYPFRIKTFAKIHKFTSQIVWLNETNADYFCPRVDTAWSGGIPATLILNNKTGYRKFFEDQLQPEVFEAELKKAL